LGSTGLEKDSVIGSARFRFHLCSSFRFPVFHGDKVQSEEGIAHQTLKCMIRIWSDGMPAIDEFDYALK
jgi:hypothetical protein